MRKDGQVDFSSWSAGMITRLKRGHNSGGNPCDQISSIPLRDPFGNVEGVVNHVTLGVNRQDCVSAVNSFAQLDLTLLFLCNCNLGAYRQDRLSFNWNYVCEADFFSGRTRFEIPQLFQLPRSFSRSRISVCVVLSFRRIFVQNYSHNFSDVK